MALALALMFVGLGMTCPGTGDGQAPLDPPAPTTNQPPRVIITEIITPAGDNFAQQGDPVTIAFNAEDGESVAAVRVFASLAGNPTPDQEIPIPPIVQIGPGVGSGSVTWDTQGVVAGAYNIFAEISDGEFEVRVTSIQPVTVAPLGTAPENGSPTVQLILPASDAGLSNRDLLTIRARVKDPNSDVDDINLTFFLDTDRDPSNDDTEPPIILATDLIPAGTLPRDTFTDPFIQQTVEISLNTVPIRRETDEGGRPLPYFVRVRADDGRGGVVDRFAVGSVRILAAASDVVDLLNVGGTTAGATWQGFNGLASNESRGSRAGSAFTPMGDVDGDGIDDFAIAAQTASPFNQTGVGEAYLIYGRQRRVDPDAENGQFSQGRYSGVIDLNTVGTFVPFPPTDPRFESLFNIRGNVLPMPNVTQPPFGFGSLGITDLANMSNITAFFDTGTDEDLDRTPELVIGYPYADSIFDEEDDDPCDECSFDEDDVPFITCVDSVTFDNDVGGMVDGIDLVAANTWAPLAPNQIPPADFAPNVDFDLEDQRIVTMFSFVVTVAGTRNDEVDADFTLDLQLDDDLGPMRSVDIPTDENGNFDELIVFNVPQPNFPVSPDDPIPASAYDGEFFLFVRPSTGVDIQNIEVRVSATVGEDVDHPIRFTYFDGFPNPFSDTGGCAGEDPLPVDPLGIQELPAACPPLNRQIGLETDPRNRLGIPPDGHLCNAPEFVSLLGSFNGPNEDDMGFIYQSGFAFICAGDNMVLGVDPDSGEFLGEFQGGDDEVRRVANVNRFGQPPYLRQGGEGLRGARFRGAWYNASSQTLGVAAIYQPTSLFGYTVEALPELDTFGQQDAEELLISAPGEGLADSIFFDASEAYQGDYISVDQSAVVASVPLGEQFTSVTDATLRIFGTAQNVATVRLSVTDQNGNTFPGTERDMILWGGAGPPPDEGLATIEFDEIVGDQVNFQGFGVALTLPRAALPFFTGDNVNLKLEILPDCVTTDSSFTVTAATLNVSGVLNSFGAIHIQEGWDWTRNLENVWCQDVTDGDMQNGNDRPMSWPSLFCDRTVDPPFRASCFPDVIATFSGEQLGAGLGFARHAGDLDLDGVPDIACGAPLHDNDPFNPDFDNCPPFEPNALVDNGKTYVIFGRLVLGSGMPCEFERLEIRGTHDDDQFGRVQGNAGDMNGDGNDDFFFAAEGYDAVDGINGTPITGADAGFVGVVFGNQQLTGEIAINAEQVGTGNFRGVKFVGGSPGARLGGGSTNLHPIIPSTLQSAAGVISRGQHGVKSAGDFNLDGFEDILITAPGQEWPGATVTFTGPVSADDSVTINGRLFQFDSDLSAEDAQERLIDMIEVTPTETIQVSAVRSRKQFPDPLPDHPTVRFLARRSNLFSVSKSGTNITVEQFTRLGVAYLVFGSNTLLNNTTFILPNDLNRRNAQGNRVLKGIVFVSPYEKDTGPTDATPDQAPVEVVSSIGDIDGDGFVDIILGAPRADFINILAPNQRRQAVGDAYLIYGNEFGLNKNTQP